MADFKNNNSDFSKFFNAYFNLTATKNNRMATRVVRRDIAAAIGDLGLLSLGKVLPVILLDINSRGALIESKKKLDVDQTLTLALKFKTGKLFTIKAKVVRIAAAAGAAHYGDHYGVQFDRYNDELGDYLLETQSNLIFR
jgi:hypothetical protein